MECLFQEHRKGRFIKGHSEVSPLISEKEVKLTDVVQLLTELDTLCFTLCLEEHLDIIALFSLNTLF